MPEQAPTVDSSKGKELLDFKTHRALYSRLFLASQDKRIDQISQYINPDAEAKFDSSFIIKSPDDRDYNPVFQNLSLKERQDQWKDFKPSTAYPTAYSQWRTEFTRFMKNIKKDSNRELALKAILPDKDAATFIEDDADTLFKEFSDGKSDVHLFIKRALTNLTREGKIDIEYLKVLLPHLEWLASGLFGQQTARITSGLIELESNFHNDPQNTIADLITNENFKKGRIPIPQSHEKDILHLLYSSLTPTTGWDEAPSEDEEEENGPPPKPIIPPPPVAEPPVVVTPTPAESARRPTISPAISTARVEPKVVPPVKRVETVVNLEAKGDLIKEIDEILRQNQTGSETIGISPEKLKRYITSIAEADVQGGDVEVGKNNEITIKNLKINTKGAEITLDLVISNSPIGIKANIQKYKENWVAKIGGGRGKAEKEIAKINSTIKNRLDDEISVKNPSWRTNKVSILDGKVLIEFGKPTRK